jgi:c-di-GMP-binding flagellar brake protein YcgR
VFQNLNKEKGSFISWVEDINSDKIIIGGSIVNGNIVRMEQGSTLFIYFIKDCDLYRFKAKVINAVKKGNIYFLVVKKVDLFENIQRREFYRLKTILNAEFIIAENNMINKAIVKDISGGGVCLITNKKLNINDHIKLRLFLKDQSIVRFDGKVVRRKDVNNSYNNVEFGIRFININHKKREEFIRYIFIEEIKLRKKGMI